MVATLDLKPLFEVGFHDVIDPKTEPILLEVKNIAEYLCEYSINPFSTNVIFPYSKVRMAHYIYWGVTGYDLKIYFLSPKSGFVLANSTGYDEMWHNATFHQSLHSLPKNLFWSVLSSKG